MNDQSAPAQINFAALMRTLAEGLGIPVPPPSEARSLALHRAFCLGLASKSIGAEASTYDRIAAADYLENGYHPEPEPQECSCQTAEASHPRGDEAYCEMRQ